MRTASWDEKKAKKLARILRLAGEPVRLRILCVLFEQHTSCVSEVAAELSMSVAAVSHHLLALSKAGLLESVRKGKNVCYGVSGDAMTDDLKRFICKYK